MVGFKNGEVIEAVLTKTAKEVAAKFA